MTVQELIDGRYKLTAWCHRSQCAHHAVLDLLKLREKLGPDHGAMHDDIVPKLRCAKCGGKKIGLILTPPPLTENANPMSGASSRRKPR